MVSDSNDDSGLGLKQTKQKNKQNPPKILGAVGGGVHDCYRKKILNAA